MELSSTANWFLMSIETNGAFVFYGDATSIFGRFSGGASVYIQGNSGCYSV